MRPYILTPESIAAKVALRSTVDIIESEFTRGIYTARVWDLKTISCEEYSYRKGIVDIHNELTGEKNAAAFWVFYHEPLASLAYVLPTDGHEYPDVDTNLKKLNIADCEISLQRAPGIQIFSLPELDLTDRQEIITNYFEGTLQSIYSDYHDYWRNHEDTLRRIGSYDMTLPQTVRDALRSLFEIELINSLKDGARTLSSQTITRAVELKDMIVANKLDFNKTVVTEYISELIDRTVGEIYSNWQRFNWELLDMTVDIIRDLDLEPKLCYLQEAILRLLELQLVHRIDNLIGEMQFADKETLKAREQLIKTEYHLCSVIVFIASNIGIHTEQYRLQLRLVEKFIGDTFFSDNGD